MKPRAGIVGLFALLLGYCCFRAFGDQTTPLYRIPWRAEWIRYPGGNVARTYFRKVFSVPESVSNAWIRISADNDYTLFVNGSEIGWEKNLSSNTSSFQSHQSQADQKIGNEPEFPTKNPPEAQWTCDPDWSVATFYDIAPLLQQGQNVFAVAVQSDREFPRLLLEGEIADAEGEKYWIGTDDTWVCHPLEVLERDSRWFHREFDSSRWLRAQSLGSPEETVVANLDPEIFRLPPGGEFIFQPPPLGSEAYLRKRFALDAPPEDAWIRIASQGAYHLFINGTLANSGSARDHVDAFHIGPLLQEGRNAICVRVENPPSSDPTHRSKPNPSGFLMDGLVRKTDGSLTWLHTDGGWEAAASADPDWTDGESGSAAWGPPASFGKPGPSFPREFPKRYRGTIGSPWNDFRTLAVFALVSLLVVGSLWLFHSAYLRKRYLVGGEAADQAGVLSFWPGLFLMAGVVLLDFTYAESAKKILFYQRPIWQVAAGVSLLSVLAIQLRLFWVSNLRLEGRKGGVPSESRGASVSLLATLYRFRHGVALSGIVLLGAYLRLAGLGSQPYHSDESSSLSAVLGILRTGVPEYTSGVWYTRGPLYHYITALSMWLFGTDAFAARLPSALFGILSIPLLYLFAREFWGNRKAGLLAALILAVSPWAIFTSGTLRFYQQFQFFGLLTVYCFLKGFVVASDKRYQNYTFLWFTLMFLSQEVAVTLLPALGLAYWVFTPWRGWREHSNLWAGILLVGLVVLADALLFLWKCLTPFVGITATCLPVMKIHLSDIWTFFVNFFVGYNRFHLVLSFFFLLGFPLWHRKGDCAALFLYFLTVTTIGVVTVTVMQVGLRYVYDLYPILILLSSLTVFELAAAIARSFQGAQTPEAVRRMGLRLQPTFAAFAIPALLLAYQPDRILGSFSTRINREDTDAHRFVKAQMRPTDVIVEGHHPGAVANAIGRCDYYLLQRSLYDEIFKKDGVLIDRRGGAKIVDTLDKLRKVFETHDRAWLVISDLRLSTLQEEVVDFLQRNTRIVFQPFLCTVFLWDAGEGRYSAPNHRRHKLFYF